VQWHPEVFDMDHADTRHVFQEFIAAAARYRGE